MRVLVWIAEETWEDCVEQSRELLPAEAEITLLHVAPGDVEDLAAGARAGLLGRRTPRHREPALRAISDEEAQALLGAARTRLGREVELVARRGRAEREVLEAAAGADLLVLARDGAPGGGPRSLGPRVRFVVDHAGCAVLLIAGDRPGGGPGPPAPAPPPPSPSPRPPSPPLPSRER